MDIKFFLKYEPTKAFLLSRKFLIFGGLLLLIYSLIFSLGDSLPVDFLVLHAFKIMPFFDPILLVGFIGTGIGLALRKLKWRKGKLEINHASLNIYGAKTISIPKESILEIYESSHDKMILRVDSKSYDLTIKFTSKSDLDYIYKGIKTLPNIEKK